MKNLRLSKILLIMKISTLLLFLICINISAVTFSQKFSFEVKGETIKDILAMIEGTSDYKFLYRSDLIDVNSQISLDVNNENIQSILDRIFDPDKTAFRIIDDYLIVISQKIGNQQQNVTGQITDAYTGEPMPGVFVIIEGTTIGVTTDAKGDYVLPRPESEAIVLFSFIGYTTQKVTYNNENVINIQLTRDVLSLEEVVVVGYGTLRKRDLTGAVARSDLSTLENSPNVNVLQSLKGIVPGLNIGAVTRAGDSPSISIRGQNSISGTTSPLIVLDGIIYRGDLVDINPNDIESIDVLKDASSAAIYGSQGANGVLLITTKTSKQMSKPIIEYSGQITLQSLINKDMERLDRDGFLSQIADIFISQSRMGTDLLQVNPDFDPVPYFKYPGATTGYYDGTNVDWWDLLSNPQPFIQSHNLSLRGKNEQASYFVSFGYSDQKNIAINDAYKRYSFRVNLDTKVTNWLKVGTQSYFNLSDFSGIDPGFSNLCSMPALVNPYNADGTLIEIPYSGSTNPLLIIDNPNKDVRQIIAGNFYGEISVPWVKGLSYRINYSNSLTTSKYYNFDPYANTGLGSANKSNGTQNQWSLDNILTYVYGFGAHSVNTTLVYGVEEREYETTNAAAENFTNKTLGYNYIQGGQADLNVVTSNAWKETSLYTMARGVYTYKDRYILTATVRRDGFSGFGQNNKFGVFPSLAVAWLISEEGFIKNNIQWMENLKLRLSYGSGGNRTIGRYATMAQMSTSGEYLYGDGATGELAQSVGTMSNNDLKWETTTSLNSGLDFSVLKGRIFGNLEYYNSKTTDLLYNINIPVINGTSQTSIPTNIGELMNHGLEFSISFNPIKRKDLDWLVTANFSTNKNKVVTILGIDADNDGKEDDLIASNIFIGEPLGTIYDFNIIGMWQVADHNAGIIPNGFYYGTYKVEDINEDGSYTADKDRKILGYSDPLYRFSFQNTLRYKGFELRAFINSVQGGKKHYLGQPGSNLPIPDHLQGSSYFKYDYWTPENPNARYRQLGAYTPTLGSGFSPYISRNFIRLQELSLTYNFSSDLLNKINISRVRVYLSASNLLTITNWDGWDPEANQGLTYNVGGYPTMKGYTFGFNFEF